MKTGKIGFFQLRLKKYSFKQKMLIGKKIKRICTKNDVKFLVNDDPILAKKLGADGCHLGQKDIKINEARKIIGNKIIGVTCHNSIKLAKIAVQEKASYIAFGAFFSTKTKKIKIEEEKICLLYTSDAADDSLRVDLGGRRIIKKNWL